MCLHPELIPPVPKTTARVARAAFSKGNRYMRLRDELGLFYQDEDFAELYPERGQTALAPWRLSMILIMQYARKSFKFLALVGVCILIIPIKTRFTAI